MISSSRLSMCSTSAWFSCRVWRDANRTCGTRTSRVRNWSRRAPPPAPGGRPPPARSRPARPNRPPVARSARRLWGCAGVWSRAASCRSPGARSQLALHKQKQNMYNFWLPNGSRATERRNIFKQTLHYLSKILFKPGSCLDASRVAWQLKFLGQIDTWEKIKTKFSLLIFKRSYIKYCRLFRARFRNWFLMDRSDK